MRSSARGPVDSVVSWSPTPKRMCDSYRRATAQPPGLECDEPALLRADTGRVIADRVGQQVRRAEGIEEGDEPARRHPDSHQVGHALAGREVEAGGIRPAHVGRVDGEEAATGRRGHGDVHHDAGDAGRRDPALAGHVEREGAAAADRRGGHPAEAAARIEQSGQRRAEEPRAGRPGVVGVVPDDVEEDVGRPVKLKTLTRPPSSRPTVTALGTIWPAAHVEIRHLAAGQPGGPHGEGARG